jgi:hypothetical protein
MRILQFNGPCDLSIAETEIADAAKAQIKKMADDEAAWVKGLANSKKT